MYLLNNRKNYDSNSVLFNYYQNNSLIKVSYNNFVEDVEKTNYYLINKFGNKKSTPHIGIIARNCYRYIVWMYSIISIGGVFVPLNIEKSQEEIVDEITKSELDCIVHDGEYCLNSFKFKEKYKDLLIDINEGCNCDRKKIVERKDNELAMIIFTSGTTNNSKGVSVSIGAINENVNAFSSYFNKVENRIGKIKFLSCLPYYHIYQISLLMACISCGYEISLCTNIKNLPTDIERYDSNYLACVPIILETFARFLQTGNNKKIKNIKEIMCAGAKCNPKIISLFLKNNIRVTNDYGMTEMATIAINESNDEYIIANSVGKPFGNTKIKIKNKEILVKGPSLMSGYYNNVDETKKVLIDEWFHTGDLGYIDKNGYLYIDGRKKNVIILSSGENVNPEELENLIAQNDKVKEIIVREKDGNICGEIYADHKNYDSIVKYIDEVNKKVAIYKRITSIEFRNNPFPKTGSGKIVRS